VGGVGSTWDAIFRACDGFPVAPVSVLESISRGPCCAHAYHLVNLTVVVRYVHGTRVVCPVLQPTGESRVEVLDFNVHASRAPTAAEKLAAAYMGIDTVRPPEGARFVCGPSVFAAEAVFANEVVTALPYYSMPAPGQCEPYVGYMIDEQRLLGLKVRLVRWGPCSLVA
jgi:hypothetical protein